MARPAATIVIPVWNQWTYTKICLETLRPTLHPKDRVVVVDNGSTDETPSSLGQYPWLTVIRNDVNLGFAPACNQGAAWKPTNGPDSEVVVYLNNDTVLTGRWLNALLAPFDDEAVGATGPRSNYVSGPQMVEPVGYSNGDIGAYRKYVKQWEAEHRSQVTPVTRLVGFALAVRRSAIDQIGGFDEGYAVGGCEDDDLCTRLVKAGWKLLIAHESFVHHHGHATFDGNGLDWYAIQQHNVERYVARHGSSSSGPLLSACLIVKNEEANLAECLSALGGVVDEIVVYDTGSTDGTLDIAAAHGAQCLSGYWDDDFARARNASLEHCRGEWVLHIDADEVLLTDAASFRSKLHGGLGVDAFLIPIDNLVSDGDLETQAHLAARVFRRDRALWKGRLHEQLVPRRGQTALRSGGTMPGARILHSGYTVSAMRDGAKAARNLRVAELEAAEHPSDAAEIHLGRSLTLAERLPEALEHYRKGRDLAQRKGEKVTALQFGIDCLLALRMWDEALEWITELDERSDNKTYPTFYRAKVARQKGQLDEALALLAPLDSVVDELGNDSPPGMVAFERANLLLDLGRPGEAFAGLMSEVESGELLYQLATVVALCRRTVEPLELLANAVPFSSIRAVARSLTWLDPSAADELGEALWHRVPGSPDVLAAMIRCAPHLGLTRCLEWSARLHASGAGEHCPLIGRSKLLTLPPGDRVKAAAISWTAFGDPRGKDVASALLAEIDGLDGLDGLDGKTELLDLELIAPDLVPALLRRSQTTKDLPGDSSGPITGKPPLRCTLILVVDHDHTETRRCLTQIARTTPAQIYDIVILADRSHGQTDQLLGHLSGDLQIIDIGPGVSRSAAFNLGASAADSDVYVFMDNHSHPLAGWLEPLLLELSRSEDTGVVGSRLLNDTGTLHHTGYRIATDPLESGESLTVVSLFQGMPATLPVANARSAMQAVGRGCLATSDATFGALDGFDPGYVEHLHDVDYCLRASARGRRSIYQPASVLVRGEACAPGEDDLDLVRLRDRWTAVVEADLHRGPDGWSTAEGASRRSTATIGG